MSTSIFDDEIFEISCPTCKKKIKKQVRWFKGRDLTCPHGCGTRIENEQFASELKKAQKSWDDLMAQMKRMGFKFR